jgi:hypothetical protein
VRPTIDPARAIKQASGPKACSTANSQPRLCTGSFPRSAGSPSWSGLLGHAAVAVVNADARNGTTWRKFKTDVLAAVAANETWERRIRAERWPRKIQPYIDAMLKTEVPAEISCDQAMAAAGSLQDAAGVLAATALARTAPRTRTRSGRY